MTDDTIDAVSKALRRAWQLGQIYWQQADSESWTQQAKSDGTQKKFEALVDETRALLSASNSAAPKGWKLVPVEPTDDMLARGAMASLGIFLNGGPPADHRDACPLELHAARASYINMLAASPAAPAQSREPFQARVQPWMLECFGSEIAADTVERNHRFFEEAAELVQACGMTASEAHQLVDYTWSRPVGEMSQEVGGVMVTLAALCLANFLDMHADGETELARITRPDMVIRIRAKQASKPKHSPLPQNVDTDGQ